MTAAADGGVSLLFVGDLSFARHVAEQAREHGGGDPRWLLAPIKPLLDAHDIVFANLECAVTDSLDEEATVKTYRIRADTAMAAHLKDSGVDVVSVANNHAMDFGAQGHQSTLATMAAQGIVAVGSVPGQGLQAPQVVVVDGVKIGFLAYNQHGDEYRHPDWNPAASRYVKERLLDDVRAARPLVDYLVVSMHGGPELSHTPDAWQQRDANDALDAGADAWIGHHPHVAQPWQVREDGKLIVYSLGDFLFDKTSPWLRFRNKPRLYVGVRLTRGVTGGVHAEVTVHAGDQDEHYRPLPAPDSFDVDAFRFRPLSTTSLSAHLHDLQVVRLVDGDELRCDDWQEKRMRLKAHAFRWLAPRWRCLPQEDERRRPWWTVAATTERFDGVPRRGLWAHPHAGGALQITWPDVVFTEQLVGIAGVPDWGVVLADERGGQAPVHVEVIAQAADHSTATASVDVAAVRGVTPIALATPALSGKRGQVFVRITGGSAAAEDLEGRFVLELDPTASPDVLEGARP